MGCSSQTVLIFFFLFFAMATTMALGQGTRVGFYSRSCPRAESIVQATVRTAFNRNPNIAPGLLTMHFHDCFVQGCDGSVLIAGPSTERTGIANSNLRGFEVIDDAKTQLEAACPGVVSCADILTLATRDSVVLANGLSWAVPTGRRDGRVSLASDTTNLPLASDSVEVQKQKFAAVGLNTQDLVTLAGAHTLGTAACVVFRDRLFNFNNTGSPDPTIDPAFLPQLQAQCPANGDRSTRVGLDTGSTGRFDTSYYSNLRNGRGVLASDQALWTDTSTRTIVQRFLGIRGLLGLTFGVEFGKSMVKMGNIGVKTGINGEIRRVCSAIN